LARPFDPPRAALALLLLFLIKITTGSFICSSQFWSPLADPCYKDLQTDESPCMAHLFYARLRESCDTLMSKLPAPWDRDLSFGSRNSEAQVAHCRNDWCAELSLNGFTRREPALWCSSYDLEMIRVATIFLNRIFHRLLTMRKPVSLKPNQSGLLALA
jgi:hypothetical protein